MRRPSEWLPNASLAPVLPCIYVSDLCKSLSLWDTALMKVPRAGEGPSPTSSFTGASSSPAKLHRAFVVAKAQV